MYYICRGKYEICNPNKSASAAALYMDLRYETYSECKNPCTKMKVAIATKYKFKLQNKKDKQVKIRFPTEIELSVETVTKSLFSTSKLI